MSDQRSRSSTAAQLSTRRRGGATAAPRLDRSVCLFHGLVAPPGFPFWIAVPI